MARPPKIYVPQSGQAQDLALPSSYFSDLGLRYADPLGPAVSDRVSGKASTVVGTKQVAKEWGVGRGFGSTLGVGTSDRVTTGITDHADERTWVIRANRNGSGGSSLPRLFDKGGVEIIYLDVGGSNIVIQRTGTANGAYQWAVALTAGTTYVIAISWSFTVMATPPKLYINGFPVSGTWLSTPSGTYSTNTSAIDIGNRASDGARHFDGVLSDAFIFDRMLSDADIYALSSDIGEAWQPRYLDFPASVGGAPPTLTSIASSLITTAGARLTVN